MNEKTIPNKHNKWIDGFDKGETFFSGVQVLGKALLWISIIITLLFFWIAFTLAFPEYTDIGVLMFLVVRLAILLIMAGWLFKVFCGWVHRKLYAKEAKELELAAQRNYGDTKKRR